LPNGLAITQGSTDRIGVVLMAFGEMFGLTVFRQWRLALVCTAEGSWNP
jgi:hypothetical protein